MIEDSASNFIRQTFVHSQREVLVDTADKLLLPELLERHRTKSCTCLSFPSNRNLSQMPADTAVRPQPLLQLLEAMVASPAVDHTVAQLPLPLLPAAMVE